MAKSSMHSYSKQAKVSVYLSIIAIIAMLGASVVMWRQYKPDLQVFLYGRSIIMFVILGGLLGSMGLAFLSIVLGFNSAGQKRNEFQKQSWIGFFLGTGIMSLSAILLFAFWTMKMSQAL